MIMAKLIVYAKILKTEFLDVETLHDFSPIKESRDKEKKKEKIQHSHLESHSIGILHLVILCSKSPDHPVFLKNCVTASAFIFVHQYLFT